MLGGTIKEAAPVVSIQILPLDLLPDVLIRDLKAQIALIGVAVLIRRVVNLLSFISSTILLFLIKLLLSASTRLVEFYFIRFHLITSLLLP